MQNLTAEQPVLDFYTYPPMGTDDFNYAFASAQVRVLESVMLSYGALVDMANAPDFEQVVDMLASTEYSPGQGNKSFDEMALLLITRRTEVRDLFKELIDNKAVVGLLQAREDFANMRLALRRKLTEKPLGTDYSNDGTIPAEQFEQIFEEENYSPLPMHMQQAVESAVLAYYQNKEIRDIDFALDKAQAERRTEQAKSFGCVFSLGLFRTRIDLNNIRTMLRLKFTDAENRNVFLPCGYIEIDRFKHAVDIGYEAIAQLFYATPYYEIVEAGISYLVANNSFIGLEQKCQSHITGFLKSAFIQITAGQQTVIAYLLLKENEIRNVRLILTAKKNNLDTKLILDRLA